MSSTTALQSEPAKYRRPCCECELDHMEELVRAIAAVTVDPIRNIASFFFPSLSAYFSNYTKLRPDDRAQTARFGAPEHRIRILNEVEQLRQAAGIWRNVGTYTSDYHAFSSCGGTCSIDTPTLIVPHYHFFRRERPNFLDPAQDLANDPLKKDPWRYTDDETRFFIGRELAHITANYAILRVVIKILFVAALFSIYALPVGWIGGAILLLIDIGIYLISERCIQRRIDLKGVKILTKRFETEFPKEEAVRLAATAAHSALKKQVEQNIRRRDRNDAEHYNPLCRLYVTKKGNNLLDVNHPFLTSRIAQLEEKYPFLTELEE